MPLDQVDVDDMKKPGGTEMSFFDHIEALRWHLIRSFIVVGIICAVLFSMKDFLFEDIIFGPKNKNFITFRLFCKLGENFCFSPPDFKVQNLSLGENMNSHLSVSFLLAIVFAFPYILWELWRFIAPGLYDEERKAARGMVVICTLLFAIGVLFGYFILAPFSISFLAGYEIPETTTTTTLTSYTEYLTMLTLPIGLIFEMPVIMFFLTKIGIVSSEFLKKQRRIAFVIILIVAGIITPPDVVSQVIVMIPLYSLYEASIVVSSRQETKKKLKQAREDARLLEEGY